MKRQQFKRVKTSDGSVLKSGLEEAVFNYLHKVKLNFTYEGMKIVYFQPAIKIIKEQNKNLDIRFIFSNSKNKIGKKSKTTYGKWCELFGFKYHCIQSTKETFPKEWLKEIKDKQNG